LVAFPDIWNPNSADAQVGQHRLKIKICRKARRGLEKFLEGKKNVSDKFGIEEKWEDCTSSSQKY
jgi:hypothetical protein